MNAKIWCSNCKRYLKVQQLLYHLELGFEKDTLKCGLGYLMQNVKSCKRLYNISWFNTRQHSNKYFIIKSELLDLHMWISFLKSFNRVIYFWIGSELIITYFFKNIVQGHLTSFVVHISMVNLCFYPWPQSWALRDMTVLVFVPVVFAISLLGNRLRNKKIIFT